MNKIIVSITTSIKKCKAYIVSVFIVYCFSCLIGIIMVQTDNNFALSQRDKIVGIATHTDKASISYQQGNSLRAALYDFTGNLFLSITQTFLGLGLVIPYFTTSYQGWIGGIVSVDNFHKSRLKKIKSALYYFIVLFLHFTAYSLSIGAGIKTGVEVYKQNNLVSWRFWKYRIRKENLLDVIYIYMFSVPIFFVASFFEFFSSWNI